MTQTLTNRETQIKGYSDRLARFYQQIAEAREDIQEVRAEMKCHSYSTIEIDAASIAAKLSTETPDATERRQKREEAKLSATEIAERLGSIADLPLGQAAIHNAAK